MYLVTKPESIQTDWRCQIPHHLLEIDWLHFEQARAFELAAAMSRELKQLAAKTSVKHVHDSRVVLRRWGSVWSVMKKDGWNGKKFKSHAGRKIKHLRRLLGELRDWDVTLELGEQVGCGDEILHEWSVKRRQLHGKVKKELLNASLEEMTRWLSAYLDHHPAKLKNWLGNLSNALPPAYEHLERYLSRQEEKVALMEPVARSPEELHKLRLAIKRWRYLLTEFFGLTNLELVKAQQHLGKIHDYDRLTDLLAGKGQRKAESRIKAERQKLKRKFNALRKNLPYGLRPSLSSFKFKP